MKNKILFGVIIFPGSNCVEDVVHVIEKVLCLSCKKIWHKERELGRVDCVILPGGFSYGDYLRAGAIARFSPIMNAIIKFAQSGGIVLGICNGFQILLEAGLLQGAMRVNKDGKFHCHWTYLRCENTRTIFTNMISEKKILKIPIAHREGNYYVSQEKLQKIEENHQVLLRYVNKNGDATEDANPNGSISNIAGIINKKGNVFGLMPHPERASEDVFLSKDGLLIFKSILKSF